MQSDVLKRINFHLSRKLGGCYLDGKVKHFLGFILLKGFCMIYYKVYLNPKSLSTVDSYDIDVLADQPLEPKDLFV